MLKYRLLEQLFVAFKAEFDNLNQSLRDRYSNYYVDTMPGLLIDNLIDNQVTLYYIDSKNLAKFSFNFVENSWWNKKNHQYDNLKNNFV